MLMDSLKNCRRKSAKLITANMRLKKTLSLTLKGQRMNLLISITTSQKWINCPPRFQRLIVSRMS
jgi:hypothetical protein